MGWRKALGLGLALLLGGSGCGYRVASKQRNDWGIRVLAVPPLENRSTTFEVEQVLRKALVRGLVERTSYRITSEPQGADAVLRGAVTGVRASPVIFGQSRFGTTFLVVLNVSLELVDQRSGKVLFANPAYTFREQYVINVDVQNFFSELNPALDRIAEDFASSVVSTIVESF